MRWLSSILDLNNEPLPIPTESDRVYYDGGHRKRRKLGTHRHILPSPPSSEPTRSMADLPQPSLKRSRDPNDTANLAQSDETQDQSTPRPGRLQQTQITEWSPFSDGSSHGSQSWTSSPSSHSAPVLKRPKSTSSRTSPSRQLRNAEINQAGFRMGSFRLDTYPDSLNALRCELRDIGLGDGILPASLEHEARPSATLLFFMLAFAFAFSNANNVATTRRFRDTTICIRPRRSHTSAYRSHRNRLAANRLGTSIDEARRRMRAQPRMRDFVEWRNPRRHPRTGLPN